MGPVQSIKTCLTKSFQLLDRTSRSEFRWFALGWSPVVAAAFLWVKPTAIDEFNLYGVFALRVLMCFPLLAAATRRGVDAGYTHGLASMPFSGVLFGVSADELFRLASPQPENHGAPVTIVMLIISVPPLIYMLTRPSKPGPNPLEVTP